MDPEVILKKAEEFLESRKYSNNLPYILGCLDEENVPDEVIVALDMIFSELLIKRKMLVQTTEDDDVMSDYVSWLRNCYEQCWTKLLKFVSQFQNNQALSTLLTFIALEGKYPLLMPEKGEYYVPSNKIEVFIRCVICGGPIKSSSTIINEYTNYLDFVYFTWLNMPSVLDQIKNNDCSIDNALSLLEELTIPSELELTSHEVDVLLFYTKRKPKFKANYSQLQRKVTESWNIMTKWKHTSTSYMHLLKVLVEHILPHLEKPALTLDFLMRSLDFGGPIALLALHGVFILVKDFNLEHPDIFAKLYSLVEPEILNTKHKSRLFYFVDLFMKSTHLPKIMVASFIKRISRLCLSASSENIIIMVTLIRNLMIRHPGLNVLISNPVEQTVTGDPFLEDERDPMKTKALESSLWELQALENHVIPQVSKIVGFIGKKLPQVETDLTPLLKGSLNENFKPSDKKKLQNISVTFERPASICMPRTEYFTQLWSLTT